MYLCLWWVRAVTKDSAVCLPVSVVGESCHKRQHSLCSRVYGEGELSQKTLQSVFLCLWWGRTVTIDSTVCVPVSYVTTDGTVCVPVSYVTTDGNVCVPVNYVTTDGTVCVPVSVEGDI